MSNSQCISCGANLKLNSSSKYVICEYCGSTNANFKTFESSVIFRPETHVEVPERYQSLLLSYDLNDLQGVVREAQKIIDDDPQSWIATMYLAISKFYLGYNDFDHLSAVKLLLKKAEIVSGRDEKVIDASKMIANDVILLGCKNKPYGEELKDAIRAFRDADEMSHIDEESLNTKIEYLKKAYEYIQYRLDDLVKKQKADYDPPRTLIANLYDVAVELDELPALESFYLHGAWYLRKHNTANVPFEQQLSTVNRLLSERRSNVANKVIEINSRGKLRIR